MKRTALVVLLLVAPTLALYACKKPETDDAQPSSKPVASSAPSAAPVASTVVAVEQPDAGATADDAGDGGDAGDAGHATGAPNGIAKCCAALASNQKSAPLEQQGAYALALGACNAAKSNPNTSAALAQVRALLKSAPPACQ